MVPFVTQTDKFTVQDTFGVVLKSPRSVVLECLCQWTPLSGAVQNFMATKTTMDLSQLISGVIGQITCWIW